VGVSHRSVLAIGAHPTDIEYFASGALARMAREGSQICLVVCTDGAHGFPAGPALAEARREEAMKAARVLGVEQVVMLDHPDGGLESVDLLRRALVQQIRLWRAELVLCHDPTTHWRCAGSYVRLGHSDHRAAGQATLDAIHPRAAVRSYYPELAEQGMAPWLVREVWLFDTARPDHFVDVSHTRELKHAALGCHVSQLPISLIEESDEEAEAWRAQSGHPAEAFRRLILV